MRAGVLTVVTAAPVTLTYIIVVAVCALITRGNLDGWAAGIETTIDKGQWWTPVSSLTVAPHVATIVAAIVIGAVALLPTERALGVRRTIASGVGGGAIAVIIAVLLQAALNRIPELESFADGTIADPLIPVTAAVATASAFVGVLWRRRVRLILGSLLAVFALYAGDDATWVRLLAFVVGLVIGRWSAGPAPAAVWRSSVQEQRNLVAGFVALVAVGPLAALASGGGRGPMALAVSMFADVDARLTHRCNGIAEGVSRVCDHQAVALLTRGVGPALLAIVPLALLILAAVGLRVGRRAGWLLAMITAGVLLAGEISVAAAGAAVIPGTGAGQTIEAVLWAVGSVGLPASIVLVLMSTRRAFPVRVTRRASWRLTAIIATTFVVLFGFYLIAESVARHSWQTLPTPGEAFAEALRRFVPPALLYDAGQPPVPHHGPGLFIWQWVGVVFWVVVVAAILALYRRTDVEQSARREKYLEAMAAGDGGTLEWLGTWAGAQHWFTDDGRSAVSYRVVSDVALAISDPVCTPDRRAATMSAFAAFAIDRGWTPVFYSVHDEAAADLEAMGWSRMTVAEETLIRPPTWTMAGKAGEKVRHPVTRMQREGVRALWTTWDELSPRHNLQIRQISEQWVAEKSLPEMGFTLGSLPEMRDEKVRLMLAIDAEDRVIGVTSWLPSWREGVLHAWTLDVMRRHPEAPNGVMEFLIASAAAQMKDDGIAVLSMSGAPLATGEEAPSGAIGAILARVSETLEPLYGFGSLFRFKKKFRPEYARLSMCYSDPMQLGSIGYALVRAYLPLASDRDVLAMARGLFEKHR